MARYIKKFFLICGVLLCVGCGKDIDKDNVNNGTSDNISQEEITHENMQNSGDYFKNVNIVQDYNPNSSYIEQIKITIDNDLMYSIVHDNTLGVNYIYVADFKTGVQMPLCSKIDCSHNNDRCNAYIGGTKDEKINVSNIYSIDNVIYIFGEKVKTENYSNSNSEYFLMRISSDGSIREDLGTILTVYGDSKDTIKEGSLFHRGFLYYVVGEGKISTNGNDIGGSVANKIYRYSIDGSGKPECIYDISYSKEQMEVEVSVMLAAQGENLYVRQTVTVLGDNNYFKQEYEEYKINTDTLEKEKTDTGINYCSQTERNSLLCVNRYNTSGDIAVSETNAQLEYEEMCRMQKMSFYNNTTKEIKNLTEKHIEDDEWFDINDFWVTDKYICLNATKINGGNAGTYIFDFEWNLIKKLDDIDRIDHCFGEYIIWHESSDDGRIYYMADIEACLSGNKRYGEVFRVKDTSTDVNRYIYKE